MNAALGSAGSGSQTTTPEGGTDTTAYDPGAHTVAEVQTYVSAHPDQTAAIHQAEINGKNRSTLVAWLNNLLAGGEE